MSPEAIQSPSSVDACSDIYSVGGVAYFLSTGRPLFTANSTMELCEKHISETPIPPSDMVDGFPEDLESVIMSCLAKDRSRCPQTARDLARQLLNCQAANWSSDAADRWWERHERQAKLIRAPKLSTNSTLRPKSDMSQRNTNPIDPARPYTQASEQPTPPSIVDFSLSREDDPHNP
jgi:serine/threonine protein kinase